MTQIEDLVRSTTRALAGTVGTVRPLTALPQEPSLDEVSRRRSWRADQRHRAGGPSGVFSQVNAVGWIAGGRLHPLLGVAMVFPQGMVST